MAITWLHPRRRFTTKFYITGGSVDWMDLGEYLRCLGYPRNQSNVETWIYRGGHYINFENKESDSVITLLRYIQDPECISHHIPGLIAHIEHTDPQAIIEIEEGIVRSFPQYEFVRYLRPNKPVF